MDFQKSQLSRRTMLAGAALTTAMAAVIGATRMAVADTESGGHDCRWFSGGCGGYLTRGDVVAGAGANSLLAAPGVPNDVVYRPTGNAPVEDD